MSETKELLKYVPTTCPYCGVGCGLNLVVSEGKLVGVEPNKRSPINEGKLCPKGMTCWEHVQKPDRLTTPKIKKNGKFVDASWDEALDLIVKKFKEISQTGWAQGPGFPDLVPYRQRGLLRAAEVGAVRVPDQQRRQLRPYLPRTIRCRSLALVRFRCSHQPVRRCPELRPDRHVGFQCSRGPPACRPPRHAGQEEGNPDCRG